MSKYKGVWHTFLWVHRMFAKFLDSYKSHRVKADLTEMLADAVLSGQVAKFVSPNGLNIVGIIYVTYDAGPGLKTEYSGSVDRFSLDR